MYVLKIGGSLLFDNSGNIRVEYIKELASIIERTDKIAAIVCGGGRIARVYINAARKFGINEAYLDLLGIEVSRINAHILIAALGKKAHPMVVKTIEDALVYSQSGKIVISGGFVPGQSTTTVAMEITEVLGAEGLIILTDVDGVYSKDPKRYPDAVKYSTIRIDDLNRVLGTDRGARVNAGRYEIFDPVSAAILKRSGFKVRIIDGKNTDAIKKILNVGIIECKYGTLILP